MSARPHRDEDISARHPAHVGRGRLWFALLAPPAVWIVQGSLGWFFGGRICTDMSIDSVRIVTGLISLAALVTAIAALLVARGNWKMTEARTIEETIEGYDRVEFMSVAGVFISGAFVLGIVWAGLNSALIGVCGGMR